jgi:hypothetical protein
MPSATGNYLINASWTGDSIYSSTSMIINFAVTPVVEEQSVFSVASNSTLSSFAFNSETKELSFTVAGPTGTAGYVSVSIPKSLMSDASNLQVLLDGQQLEYNVESRTDSWAVSFLYHHSNHNVVINLESSVSLHRRNQQTHQSRSPHRRNHGTTNHRSHNPNNDTANNTSYNANNPTYNH